MSAVQSIEYCNLTLDSLGSEDRVGNGICKVTLKESGDKLFDGGG
jgi:hypothetical protein